MKTKRIIALFLTLAFAFAGLPAGAVEDRVTARYTPSSQYRSGAYYTRLADAELTGDLRRDIVNVAISQIGYHEGNSPADLGGGNQNGYLDVTEFGYWFGTEVKGQQGGFYSPWCAIFTSWCARMALVPVSVISNAAYSRIGANPYHFHMVYHPRDEYLPKSGDLIFYDYHGDGSWSHVGIVAYVEKDRVVTVEGNMNKKVGVFTHSLTASSIRGYGEPAYSTDDERSFDLCSYPVPCRTLRPGAVGEDVSWLQCALLHLKYYVPVDGHYGSVTEQAVTDYQAANGISTTGNCGPVTLAALQNELESNGMVPFDPNDYPEPERTLRIGNSGEDVKWLQAALRCLGFNANTTGYFGEITQGRVIRLQKSWGITPTGNLGPVTRTAITEALRLAGPSVPSGPQPIEDQVPNPYPVPTRDLRKGNSGNDVRWVQFCLKNLGCDRLQGTGYFGDLTESYVLWFQHECGLEETGVFDSVSRGRMLEIFSE